MGTKKRRPVKDGDLPVNRDFERLILARLDACAIEGDVVTFGSEPTEAEVALTEQILGRRITYRVRPFRVIDDSAW